MVANISPVISLTGVKAVAFDLDDTLFDRQAALLLLLDRWFGETAVPEVAEEILEHDAGGYGDRGAFFAWLASRFPALERDGNQLERNFRQEFPKCIVPDPDASILFTSLRAAHMPFALLSNGNASFQAAKLRASGVLSFFSKESMLYSGTLGFAKPDRRAFEVLVQCLRFAPEEILFVGNDVVRDMAGAKTIGLRTCLMQRRTNDHRKGDADVTIDSLGQLCGILNLSRE